MDLFHGLKGSKGGTGVQHAGEGHYRSAATRTGGCHPDQVHSPGLGGLEVPDEEVVAIAVIASVAVEVRLEMR